MSAERQGRKIERPEEQPLYIVGMDAHSENLSISVWEWSDVWRPVRYREVKSFPISALEATYENIVPRDSLTVIEASTNSAMLKDRLLAIGFRAEIVRADVIADKDRKRKVCDIQDARNLANAYMKNEVGDFVWTPSPEYAEYREIFFAYRDTVKDMTRISNRIWAICSRHGYTLPKRNNSTKAEKIRAMIKDVGISGFTKEWLEQDISDYETLQGRKALLMRKMARIVLSKDHMINQMQLPGVNFRCAFLTGAVTEDPRRFPSAAKFAAYAGGAPIKDTTGKEEERAAKKGGTGKPMDGTGRTDMKMFFCEAGQTCLCKCADMEIGKWGWRKIHAGKEYNKVVCAIGRKLMTYSWHIQRGDPTPSRLNEEFFKRKMFEFYSDVGMDVMKELGYGGRKEFSEMMARKVYGDLPKENEAAEPSENRTDAQH